jgi:hypothetical protein
MRNILAGRTVTKQPELPADAPPPLLHILQPGEVLETHATAQDSLIAVTNHRLIVTEGRRTVLDIPFSDLRRIQFDVERGRDATLVIVPEHVSNEPRVVVVPIPKLRESAHVLAVIGERLNGAVESEMG